MCLAAAGSESRSESMAHRAGVRGREKVGKIDVIFDERERRDGRMKSDAIRNVDGKIGEKREREKVCEKKRG